MLHERSQTQKDKYYMFPFPRGSWNRQVHREETRLEVTRREELLFNGNSVCAGGDGMFWV